MPEHRYSLFTPQRLLQMWNLPTSNATNLPSTCDEELADEADEPPDNHNGPSHFLPHSYHGPSLSDGEFIKHAVRHPTHTESLLTRALTSPDIGPVDRVHGGGLQRGFSHCSTWSNVSEADLTSDGGLTSPSQASTPSPPPPMFLGQFMGLFSKSKPKVTEPPKPVQTQAAKDEVVEGLGRKRCITFACADKLSDRRVVEQPKAVSPPKPQPSEVAEPPKRNSTLKFVCTQRDETKKSAPQQQRCRSPAPAAKRAGDTNGYRQEHNATITSGSAPGASGSQSATRVQVPELAEPRRLYDSESVAESWTNQPIDKTRLLKVDGLLQKELDIRKLSEEAEAEEMQDEEAEDDDAVDDEDGDDAASDQDDEDEDDDDDDEDEDEEVDDDDDWGESGNETDNEEGFASEDDSDDDSLFGGSKPVAQYYELGQPLFRRSESDSSIESLADRKSSPRPIRPGTPELPDSTDFVCGTFDEDRPLEVAYLSCMEERRRSKHIPTPQDIDPSFPTSDNEDDDDGENEDDRSDRGGRPRANSIGNRKAHSRSPRGRVHSPAPLRRTTTNSPGPAVGRRTTAGPTRSRHASPAPPRRTRSPAPMRKNRHQNQFNHGGNIVRTRSLPRTKSGFGQRGGKNGNSRTNSAATSPQKTTQPMFIRRGAADIVKGLEKKRERRKARLARPKVGAKDGNWVGKAGEGVEKMREVALDLCGKGRRQAQWVLSA